jgi:hypothetical protein
LSLDFSPQSKKLGIDSGPNQDLSLSRKSIESMISQPLSHQISAELGNKMHVDFSNVQIHADDKAADFARATHSRAFTVANHIFFAPSQFSPETTYGRRLLVHELWHVAQQRIVPSRNGESLSQPSDKSEQEARRAGEIFGGGSQIGTIELTPAPVGQLQRQEEKDIEKVTETPNKISKDVTYALDAAKQIAEVEMESPNKNEAASGALRKFSENVAKAQELWETGTKVFESFWNTIAIYLEIRKLNSAVKAIKEMQSGARPYDPLKVADSLDEVFGAAGGLAQRILPLDATLKPYFQFISGFEENHFFYNAQKNWFSGGNLGRAARIRDNPNIEDYHR